MRRVFASVPVLLFSLTAAPFALQAQAGQMKPFKIEGHKIPEIKTPEQPSWKIVKPEPYKVTPPETPKTYGGQPIIKEPPAPAPARKAPARKASASKKSAASKAAARRSAARSAPAPRRAVAPRPAPASPLGFGRGRGRLLRIR